jgi:hypothetical protein
MCDDDEMMMMMLCVHSTITMIHPDSPSFARNHYFDVQGCCVMCTEHMSHEPRSLVSAEITWAAAQIVLDTRSTCMSFNVDRLCARRQVREAMHSNSRPTTDLVHVHHLHHR